MSKQQLTRRKVLRAVAGSAIGLPHMITSSALGNADTAPASERVTIGHIGVGNRGKELLRGFLTCKGSQSVAVADAYSDRREAAAKMTGGKAYADFRELLARPDIDAVVIATPDHWHVPIAMAAARAGKDAYVEKPLGVSIEQDLACRKLFREKKRIFQYGTQQRSMEHCRLGCELVRSGRIGKVHTIEVIAPDGDTGGSTETAPVPPELNYDMWIGPAPMVPYTEDRCVAPGTYYIYDYSIGYLGGWGAHPLDIMVWGSDADLAGPITVEGTGVIPDKGLYDTVIHWDLKIQLGNGVRMTFKPGLDSTKYIGPDGWVQIRRRGLYAEPKSLLESKIGPGDVHLPVSHRQDQNFIDAVKSRKPAISTIEDAVRSDVISHLCNIAIRTRSKVTWDSKKEAIVDNEAASKMLARPTREKWRI
jgi:Oxidoreductase family, C-terminal alpha/beta domain/Oxidoreductase family, NAD-binding Rossmann fold